jgi:hypothetical protein
MAHEALVRQRGSQGAPRLTGCSHLRARRAAPPGGRARARSGAQRALRRIDASSRQPFDCEGLPVPIERRCWPSAARMAKRGQHRASGRQDAGSERPARWHGQPRACVTHERPGDGAGQPRARTTRRPARSRATRARVTQDAARPRRAASSRRGCRRCSRPPRNSRHRTRWPGARRLSALHRARAGRGRAGRAS